MVKNRSNLDRPAEVLLVDDNYDDAFFAIKCFEQCSYDVNVHHVDNGGECLAMLRKEGAFSAAPTPDLILLDLNMPEMGGREVLSKIVNDAVLRRLPVVILTTSDASSDIVAMYSLRCSSYIIKPVDLNEFQRVVQSLGDYWFSVSALPTDR